ncbi:unnamed protein product [Symbiodinium sp. CCMP2592]|nr:unnamed protein product [Symbiodinium sp. CCMP2592]
MPQQSKPALINASAQLQLSPAIYDVARQSEYELQQVIAKHPHEASGPNVSDVRLNHYRVLLELLNLRCRLLEQWLEEEAVIAASQEDRHSEILQQMEQQVRELAAEVVEQQICYKEQIDAMQKQHCEDYTVWSEELIRERNEACKEIAALQEDLRSQEQLWHEEWRRMQQSALAQGVQVPNPPGFLELKETGCTLENSSGSESWCLEGRSTLETILEAVAEEVDGIEEERQDEPKKQVKSAYRDLELPSLSSPKTFASSPSEDKQESQKAHSSTGPSPSSRSARTPGSVPFSDVPEELLKSLERASDNQQTSRAWARIGQFHQRQKNFGKARSAYQKAVAVDSSQHGCLANLAQLEAHAGNVDTAKEMLTAALQLDPSNKNYLSFRRWLAGNR